MAARIQGECERRYRIESGAEPGISADVSADASVGSAPSTFNDRSSRQQVARFQSPYDERRIEILRYVAVGDGAARGNAEFAGDGDGSADAAGCGTEDGEGVGDPAGAASLAYGFGVAWGAISA
jgi:hypothetical protein